MTQLQTLMPGQEFKIPSKFIATVDRKNVQRKFHKHKSYWVESMNEKGLMITYFTYNGRNKNGVATELLSFASNKNLLVETV